MKRITFVFALLLLCISQVAWAQTIRVTGTVADAKTGDPLPDASVTVKGTTAGVSTDVNGKYTIEVSRNAVLVFGFTNYKNLEIPVNGRTVVDALLEEDGLLEEAIIVGYGTARKLTQVGSAAVVKTKAIKDRPTINVGDALQGQVAGLQVYSSSGDPSATVSMRIRGVSSINASTTPLFVLDGQPVLSDVFSTINANDIENIVILKDAASTSIYGSRAANGVVYITTKKGQGETPSVRISANYGVSSVAQNPIRMMNNAEYYAMREIADPTLLNDADFQAEKNFNVSNNIGTNWKKYMLHSTAPTMGGDFSISGRGKVVDYYLSLNANRQEGVERNTAMNRYGVRSNVNVRVTNWFKAGVNIGLTYQGSRVASYNTTGNSRYNPLNFAMWIYPYASIREVEKNPDGSFKGYGAYKYYIDEAGLWDNRYLNKYRPAWENYVRLNGQLYEELTPIKGLTIRFAQGLEGYDYRYTRRLLIDPNGCFTPGSSGWSGEQFSRYYRMSSTNTIEYKHTFAEKHNLTALVGQEAIINTSNGFDVLTRVFYDERLWAINKAENVAMDDISYSYSKSVFNSIFTRLSYDYGNKYFVDLSWRRDGSSLFGADKRYANFWSVGAMWDAKNEDFLKDVNWLNKLNISASYGTVGNSGISNYLSVGTINQTATPYLGSMGYYLGSASNPGLTWETIESFNVAADARFFDRLDLKLEYYHRTTKDMLMEIPWSYSTGFSGGWGNVGNMVNKGIEATIGVDILRKKDMWLHASLNFAYNKDEITKLFDGRDFFTVSKTGLEYTVGHSAGEFFYVRWAGVDPATGRPQWYDKNGNLTTTYNADDAVATGKSRYAPWSGGLMIDFTWKRLAVQAQFSGVFKKYMINNDMYFWTNVGNISDANKAADLLYNIWRKPGDKAKYAAVEHFNQQFDTRFIENASFVRLKNLTISYSLSDKALEAIGGLFKGLRVYVTGRNLLTWTKYRGWDPEVNSNLSLGRYPNSKQYSAGIEITF